MRRMCDFKRKRRTFPAEILFLAGFFAGLLLPNLAWKFHWCQSSLAALYLLKEMESKRVINRTYFMELLRIRGSYFGLCLLCGLTVFGVPMAILTVFATGMELGALMGVSVLEFGLMGGTVSAGLLFPQYIIYVPIICAAMGDVWKESVRMWKNHGMIPQKLSAYAVRMIGYSCIFFLGILLEFAVNPWFLEMIMKKVKFF